MGIPFEGDVMAFQDQADRFATRLHLSAVPRPVFVGIIVLLVVAVAAAVGLAAFSGGNAFEVHAADGAVAGEVGNEREGAGVGNSAEVGSGGSGEEARAAGNAAAEDVVLPSSGTDEAAPLCVHVDGAVRTPGVYYLDAGSRIVDAVAAAGGLTETAYTAAVNLAQVLQDGEQVVIPDEATGEASGGTTASGGAGATASNGDAAPVNLNRATADELVALPGIGASTAAKIVADREANGPFRAIEDLKRVSGIGDKKFEALRELVCV